jgi:hypothetical protein
MRSARSDAVATGEVKGPYASAVLAYTLEHPIPELDSLLTGAAAHAASPTGAQALRVARATYAGKVAAADSLTGLLAARGELRPTGVATFDPATRVLVASRIARMPQRALPGTALHADSARAIVRMVPINISRWK